LSPVSRRRFVNILMIFFITSRRRSLVMTFRCRVTSIIQLRRGRAGQKRCRHKKSPSLDFAGGGCFATATFLADVFICPAHLAPFRQISGPLPRIADFVSRDNLAYARAPMG
jgi:hypothetical protein